MSIWDKIQELMGTAEVQALLTKRFAVTMWA